MDILTQDYAKKRTLLFKNKSLTYHLTLRLAPSKGFSGSIKIVFESFRIRHSDVFLEFAGTKVDSVIVNK